MYLVLLLWNTDFDSQVVIVLLHAGLQVQGARGLITQRLGITAAAVC